jgi:hypothetical protein
MVEVLMRERWKRCSSRGRATVASVAPQRQWPHGLEELGVGRRWSCCCCLVLFCLRSESGNVELGGGVVVVEEHQIRSCEESRGILMDKILTFFLLQA